MLRHLVSLAERLEEEGELPPPGYRKQSAQIDWIIDVDDGVGYLREGSPSTARPYRDRSVNIAPNLLADYAYYVLGIPEEGKEKRAQDGHKAFLDLLDEASAATGDEELQRCAQVLRSGAIEGDGLEQVGPKDVVALGTRDGELLLNRKAVKEFWAQFVADDSLSEETGKCSICGEERRLLRLLPEDVSILGETPKLVSFNLSAFESYGRKQTLNASICHPCGSRAVQALNHLTKTDIHKVRIARDPRDGASASLKDHLAVFWTDVAEVETEDGTPVDPREVLQATAGGFDRDETASETEIERLLETPWHARAAALRVADAGAHVLILSPNKARLVVREWLHESLEDLQSNLHRYLAATRIQTPSGRDARAFAVRELLDALAVKALDAESGRVTSRREIEANEVRGLLRTAYSGFPPPAALRPSAIRSLRNPRVWNTAPWLSQRLVSVLKLTEVLSSSGEESIMKEADQLERLDEEQLHPGYLCGRLLAVLEDAQEWAADGQLNTTLVDRNYTAAATAPASALPRLLNQAETAHIPKIRRKSGGGAHWMRKQIEDILAGLDAAEGFPRTLNNEGQGQFALGFYHQRADIRRRKREHSESSTDEANGEE